MITGFFLGGFKAYDQINFLPIKPITLVFGPNAGGKSSLLQALAWAHHIHAGRNVDAYRMALTGPHANLGGFKMFRHRNSQRKHGENGPDTGDITIGWVFRMKDSVHPMNFTAQGNEEDALEQVGKSDHYRRFYERAHREWTPQNICSDPFHWALTYSIGDFHRYQIPREKIESPNTFMAWNQEWIPGGPKIKEVTLSCGPIEFLFDLDAEWNLSDCSGFSEKVGQLYLEAVYGEPIEEARVKAFFKEGNERIQSAKFHLNGLAPCMAHTTEPYASEDVRELMGTLYAVIEQMNSNLNAFLGGMNYLGPWRMIPSEEDLAMATVSTDEPVLKHWARLLNEKESREVVNDWLLHFGCDVEVVRTKYLEQDLVIQRMRDSWNDDDNPDGDGEEFFRQLETMLEDEFISVPARLKLQIPGRGIAITPGNTGVGISQLIPIIVAAVSGTKETLLIEQPELHLHPRLQAHLGDLLIEAAIAETGPKNCLIIETHSEHLILRILRRIRETNMHGDKQEIRLRPDDVSIVHVGRSAIDIAARDIIIERRRSQGKSEAELQDFLHDWSPTTITPLPLNPDGDFTVKWPGGFFEERLNELFPEDEETQRVEGSNQ